MSRLTRDGTAEPVSRAQILRHAQEQGNINFPCSADHEQDWQPYPVDPYSATCDDHTYIHTVWSAASISESEIQAIIEKTDCLTYKLVVLPWYLHHSFYRRVQHLFLIIIRST